VAFCRWLSRQLGYEVRLPTERQWEKAARGTDGREYPWGNSYRTGFANVNEQKTVAGPSALDQTIAVGLYPQGASPYGVMDMAGNISEWCLNKSPEPDYSAIDVSGQGRVTRGGYQSSDPDNARTAHRIGARPDEQIRLFGFRVVCESPIVRKALAH
jgi:formylglycine-generating enzyme required for sulfatase activity